MKRLCAAWVLVWMTVAQGPASGQPAGHAEGSVFRLLVMNSGSGHYESVLGGTAFFINADGTALTNSHVVYRADHDPDHYKLLAIVDKEFYSVAIVCASRLTRDPTRVGPDASMPPERDVAVIKLGPSKFPFTRLGYSTPGGEEGVAATAHLRALPPFPALTLGDDPAPGDRVWIVGFGKVTAFESAPAKWVANGTVHELGTASDETPMFRIGSLNRSGPGGSGSPVLDSRGRVVGIYTWGEVSGSAFSEAIASSALKTPCP